jgi:hypothetical protein
MLRNRIQFLSIFLIVLATLISFDARAAEGIVIEDCVIEPNKVAEVSSAAIGVIDKLAVKRGDRVK